MINVSNEFRELIKDRRDIYPYLDITFKNGTSISVGPDRIMKDDFHFVDGPGDSKFPLGAAICKTIKFSLSNYDGYFSDYDFYDAEIDFSLKFKLSSTTETIKKGTYIVITPTTPGRVIDISASDYMSKTDKDYTTSVTFPTTIDSLLRDCCSKCDIVLATQNFNNKNFQVKEKPEVETYRELIGYIAQIAGGNARINENNQLEIINFNLNAFPEKRFWGGIFDNHTPYQTGDGGSGGTFNPWTLGTPINGGTFGDRENRHNIYQFLQAPTIDTDDITITGLIARIQEENDEGETEEHILVYGERGYAFEIDNPLIADDQKESALSLIGPYIVGLTFRKFSGEILANPLIEFADPAFVVDINQRYYQTYITDIDYTVLGSCEVKNSAESPSSRNSSYSSGNSSMIAGIVQEANKNTDDKLSDYDMYVQNMNSLMANSLGMFETNKKTENGGRITYIHDKPTLEESQKIWERSENGFRVSEDGGKTWKAGFTSDGNAVLNVLAVIGIVADWIRAGRLESKDGRSFWDLDNNLLQMVGKFFQYASNGRKSIGITNDTIAFYDFNRTGEDEIYYFYAVPHSGSGSYDSVDHVFRDGATFGIWCTGSSNQQVLRTFGSIGNMYMRFYVDLNMGGNNITNQSDERLKDNIKLVNGGELEKIMKLPIVSFDWLTDGKHEDAGVIAQDIENLFPDCVTEDKDGVKQVIPTKLLYHTIKAVQELNDKIDGTNTVQGRIDPYTKEEKQAFVDSLKKKEQEDMERRMKANGNK